MAGTAMSDRGIAHRAWPHGPLTPQNAAGGRLSVSDLSGGQAPGHGRNGHVPGAKGGGLDC
jgi:hypothetical protein